MAEVLVYDQPVVRDSGIIENSGTVRVRDSVTVLLSLSVLVFDSVGVAEAQARNIPETRQVIDSVAVSESVSSAGLSPALLKFDSVVVSDAGSSALSGPVRVSDNIQVYLSGAQTTNLSRAVVDLCNLSEFRSDQTVPAYTLVSDLTYIYDEVGQDNPIKIYETVIAVLGDPEHLRAVQDDIAVTESVNAVAYQEILQVLVADQIGVSESQSKNIDNVYSTPVDEIAVTDSVNAVIFDELLSATTSDAVGVAEFHDEVLTPIYPGVRSDFSVVSDLAVGFLSAKQNQSRVLTDAVGVSDHVTAKYSALSVLVYDTIGTTDRKNNRSRNRWWRYLWTWRG